MFSLLPAQKNYRTDLDFRRGHLGVLKPRPIRYIELFFSGRNNDRAPASFSGRNNDRAPARLLYFFFQVVIMIAHPTLVSGFGTIFSPVASGTVVVCKNNTRVLGRSGPEQANIA